MPREETRSLDELHAAALAEGGTLTVYAGGDIPNQQDYTVDGFRRAFPDIEINMMVDYSKYHDVRIDRQLDEGQHPTATPSSTASSTSSTTSRTGCLRFRRVRPPGCPVHRR